MDKILLAAIFAAGLVLCIGPLLIPELHKLKFGQSIREEGPKSHQAKSGTPTMGGIMIILAIVVATVAAAPLTPAVLLALFIPTRPPPNLQALLAQASAVVHAEVQDEPEVLRHGLSRPALQSLDAIHDRLESPADRLLRGIEPWSSFLVLPLFALANAGVVLSGEALAGREPMILATGLGLAIGKPAGILLGCALAVALGIAEKPAGYSWRQLAGAGALAGIGFTMSLFIAGQAYPVAGDFAAAKIAVFGASLLSALVGVSILWWPHTEPTALPAETDGSSTPK